MGRFLKRQKAKRKRRADRLDRLAEERDRLKEDRKLKKIHKRHRKKSKRQGLSDEDAAITDLAEYTPAMAEQLQEQGIEVENPDDNQEVLSRYNTEIMQGDEIPSEDYNTAYIYGVDSYDSLNEHAEERSKARRRIGNILNIVGGAFKGAIESAKEKRKRGETLTDTDKRLLDLEAETRAKMKREAKSEFSKYLLPISLAVIAYLLLK